MKERMDVSDEIDEISGDLNSKFFMEDSLVDILEDV